MGYFRFDELTRLSTTGRLRRYILGAVWCGFSVGVPLVRSITDQRVRSDPGPMQQPQQIVWISRLFNDCDDEGVDGDASFNGCESLSASRAQVPPGSGCSRGRGRCSPRRAGSARYRYPYICLNTTIQQTNDIWDIYDQAAERVGYKSGPEQRGYLIRCHVADTEEKAMQNGREFMWMLGEFTGLGHPVWFSPPGYSSPESRRKRAESQIARGADPFEKQLENKSIIAGTPDQVIASLRTILEETRPSILALWGNDGNVGHDDSMDCIKLLGQEVMPALREIGKDLELYSPFEVDSPVSLAQTPASQLNPVGV